MLFYNKCMEVSLSSVPDKAAQDCQEIGVFTVLCNAGKFAFQFLKVILSV